MAITNIRASLVGMRYHGVSRDDANFLHSGNLTFQREPHNIYDKNAVAIFIVDKKVGHINREVAAIVAPLIDEGANCSISFETSRPSTIGSIPLIIKIDSPLERFRFILAHSRRL